MFLIHLLKKRPQQVNDEKYLPHYCMLVAT